MTTLSTEPTLPQKTAPAVWQWGWQTNPVLMATTIGAAGLLLLTLLGLLLDPRLLVGEPIWMKPTKFALSTVFYAGTMLWVLAHLPEYPRLVKGVSWVTAGVFLVELGLIFLQAGRGMRSHFNIATPLDATIFSIMGTAIFIMWLSSIVAMVALGRQKFADPAWGLALKLGLFLTVVGAGLGWLMTSPNADQLAQMQQGILHESGSHTVGLHDSEGGKLPVVGWSTTAGDLRIGHFIGLHALQVLPLIGWFISSRNQQLDKKKQVQLVWTAGLGYLGVMILVTWQALRGEPVIAPGLLTLSAWGGLMALIAAASFVITRPVKN